MQSLPHRYAAAAGATAEGDVLVEAERLEAFRSAPPVEFGGAGDKWSPETLFVAAVADCFILTFRGIAANSRLKWTSVTCVAVGTLDRVDQKLRFTELHLHAKLQIPAGTDEAQANRVLQKAEQNCLITNSLKATVHLEAEVEMARPLASSTRPQEVDWNQRLI